MTGSCYTIIVSSCKFYSSSACFYFVQQFDGVAVATFKAYRTPLGECRINRWGPWPLTGIRGPLPLLPCMLATPWVDRYHAEHSLDRHVRPRADGTCARGEESRCVGDLASILHCFALTQLNTNSKVDQSYHYCILLPTVRAETRSWLTWWLLDNLGFLLPFWASIACVGGFMLFDQEFCCIALQELERCVVLNGNYLFF